MRPNCQTPIENAERTTHSEVQVSINKMLKLNFATKQMFPMTIYDETRETYSWHSHRIETAMQSEFRRALVFIFDVTDAGLQV